MTTGRQIEHAVADVDISPAEKPRMVAQIANDKVNTAVGFFAVIGGCAIIYNAVQRVRKFVYEHELTPIAEEDV